MPVAFIKVWLDYHEIYKFSVVRKVICVNTIKVNSGWQVWACELSQSYQHIVKLTIASVLSDARSLSPRGSRRWLKPSCLHSFRARLPLTDRQLLPAEMGFTLKFVHFVSLYSADTMSGKQSSFSLSLFFFFFFVRQAWQWHSNRNTWQADRAWALSAFGNGRGYGIRYL